MTATALESSIVDEALRLGFAAIGFAAAGDSCSSGVFEEWLEEGGAAGMDYLRRHAPLRRHPATIAPSVRSVIAVAARYPVNPEPGDGFCMTARARDYHDVIRGKLRELAAFLGARTPQRCARICVDSAPLPEREWALRAGLGWQGRQGQLIVPGAGACTVLGFLLTDLDLQPSIPQENRCGDCRRCVESCPTRAILPSGRIAAGRCISYLTIEHQGEIATGLEPAMGQALFGCDICTAVCPWNLKASAPVLPALEPGSPPPDAGALVAMVPGEFNVRFRGTAVQRSGLDRLQRNARIALRNASMTPDRGISACQPPTA
jgi:epoxyqueuosine reductase